MALPDQTPLPLNKEELAGVIAHENVALCAILSAIVQTSASSFAAAANPRHRV